MRRINLSWFSQFGEALTPLSALDFSSADDSHVRGMLIMFQPLLESLFPVVNGYNIPLSLRSSAPHLNQLNEKIKSALEQNPISDGIKWEIWRRSGEVKTILYAELAVQPTYLIFPKCAYDTEAFIADGTMLFSDDCRGSFTAEEAYDIREATKCLAFEIPTAAAFHIVRATEAVIRRYYQVVVGQLPKVKSRNWSTYIKVLKQHGADQKITAILEEMRELYRNPIIHPETQIAIDEALSLIGIAETAISAMIVDAKRRQSVSSPPTLQVVGGQQP